MSFYWIFIVASEKSVEYFALNTKRVELVVFIDNETACCFVKKKTKKISSSESWYEPSPIIKAKRYLSRVPMYCNASNVPDKTSVTLSITFVSTIWLLPHRERTNVLLLPCHSCFPPTMLCFVAFWSILLQGAVLES